ncbi:hypothetical protein BJV82DRAFT_676557 [Fennellomyces sp. T-0311]|nr:hypothetical protein BJV82DRAFT_676557 [Fennellomyces sp. T-0311]
MSRRIQPFNPTLPGMNRFVLNEDVLTITPPPATTATAITSTSNREPIREVSPRASTVEMNVTVETDIDEAVLDNMRVQPDLPNVYGPVGGNARISWSPDTIGALVDLMKLRYTAFLNCKDDLLRVELWNSFYEDLKEMIMKDSCERPEQVAYYHHFLQAIDMNKVRSKWKELKSTYTTIRNWFGLTSIGGTDPRIIWEYYNDIGKITRDDPSIHSKISIESMDIGATGRSDMRVLARREPSDKEDADAEATEVPNPSRHMPTPPPSSPTPTPAPTPAPFA